MYIYLEHLLENERNEGQHERCPYVGIVSNGRNLNPHQFYISMTLYHRTKAPHQQLQQKSIDQSIARRIQSKKTHGKVPLQCQCRTYRDLTKQQEFGQMSLHLYIATIQWSMTYYKVLFSTLTFVSPNSITFLFRTIISHTIGHAFITLLCNLRNRSLTMYSPINPFKIHLMLFIHTIPST